MRQFVLAADVQRRDVFDVAQRQRLQDTKNSNASDGHHMVAHRQIDLSFAPEENVGQAGGNKAVMNQRREWAD